MGSALNEKGVLLRDIIDIPDRVRPGDLLVSLAEGFDTSAEAIRQYVVTPQLAARLGDALGLVGAAVRSNKSHAAYLHGSFGSGKSHFMTVLQAMLNGDQAARGKQKLQPLLAEHRGWLTGRKFLLVPYHLIGAESLDAAVLGGYVRRIREVRPDASTPAVYRDDAMLVDARSWRARMGDQAFIRTLSEKPGDPDDWNGSTWTPASLDAAFAAPRGPREPPRASPARAAGGRSPATARSEQSGRGMRGSCFRRPVRSAKFFSQSRELPFQCPAMKADAQVFLNRDEHLVERQR